MTAMGHEDAFPALRVSARCRFSQGTLAETRGNGQDAPTLDLGETGGGPGKVQASTTSGTNLPASFRTEEQRQNEAAAADYSSDRHRDGKSPQDGRR